MYSGDGEWCRHPRCRPGCRARHPGCRPGSRARHPGCRSPAPGAGSPGCRDRLFAPAQVWAARVPGAAPGAASGVPRPGCRVGRDAMEIHISRVSRAYLGSNLLVAASSARAARQVWGAAWHPRGVPGRGTRGAGAGPGVPARDPGCRRGTRGAAAAPGTCRGGTRGRHPRCRPGTRGARTILKESWQAAWTVHRELRSCSRAGCIPRRGSRGDRYAQLGPTLYPRPGRP